MVEMLFCTSLIAVVPVVDAAGAERRRLQILNTKRQSTICELVFPAPIHAVRLNRRRLVVVLPEALYVYDISNMKLLHTIDHPHSLCALAPSSESCFLAYAAPGPRTEAPGPSSHVVLYDLLTLSIAGVVQAHRSSLACIALNASGTLLATASEKGTVVRVFSVPVGRLQYQFRRGSYSARIHSLTFNAASTLLCVTSDSDTVHIFRLSPAARIDEPDTALAAKKRTGLLTTWHKQGAAVASALGDYLPTAWTDVWEPVRDFAWLKLPSAGMRTVAAVSNTLPLVFVLTHDGRLLTFALDLDRGGECTLVKRTYARLTQNTRCCMHRAIARMPRYPTACRAASRARRSAAHAGGHRSHRAADRVQRCSAQCAGPSSAAGTPGCRRPRSFRRARPCRPARGSGSGQRRPAWRACSTGSRTC